MFNAVLFAIVFLWLFVLTVWKANVNRFLKTLQDERDKVLNFISEARASKTPGPSGESIGGPEQ